MKNIFLLLALICFGTTVSFAQKKKTSGALIVNTSSQNTISQYYGKKLYVESITKGTSTTTYGKSNFYWMFNQDGTLTIEDVNGVQSGTWTYDNTNKTVVNSMDRNATPWTISSSTATKLVLTRGSDKMIFNTMLSTGTKIAK